MIYKDELEDSIDKNYGTNFKNYPQNIQNFGKYNTNYGAEERLSNQMGNQGMIVLFLINSIPVR